MARSSEKGTPSHALQRRLLSQLQLERRLHGHGAAAELDQRIGKSAGYLGRVLRGEIGLQTEQLFKILGALDVEPAEFFTTVVEKEASPKRCLQRFARTLDRFSGESVLPISSELLKALRSLQASPKGTDKGQMYRAWRDKALNAAASKMTHEIFSADTDEDSLASTAELVAAAHHAYVEGTASGSALATALRLAAAVERCHGRVGAAACWLLVSLEVVERASQAEVELLVEAVYQLVMGGQLVTAGLVIDTAQHQAVCLGGGPTLGKTLLARGAMELAKRRPCQAVVAYEASFHYLETEHETWCFLAHHGAARGHLENGRLFEAGRHLVRAAALHPTRRGPHWSRLQWTRGRWAFAGARKPHDCEQAVRCYNAALTGLDASQQPLEVVRLLLHKAKALIALRAWQRLRHTAALGLQLAQRLKKQAQVHRLLMEFARLAMTGEVTEVWLDEALAGLERFSLSSL